MRTWIVAVAGFAVGLALVGAFMALRDDSPPGSPVAITVTFDLCSNPAIETADGANAVFVFDGQRFRYERHVEKFRELECAI